MASNGAHLKVFGGTRSDGSVYAGQRLQAEIIHPPSSPPIDRSAASLPAGSLTSTMDAGTNKQ